MQDAVDGGEYIVRIRALVRLLPELAVGLAARLEVLGSD
jgi:hypothetical protein